MLRLMPVSRFSLFVCSFLAFVFCSMPHSAWAESVSIRVGTYENAPKVFTDESGRSAGIFIDILSHIAKAEGWRVSYVPGTWAEGLDRLEKGEIDLMPDMAYTPDRSKIFSFHKVPVLSSWFQVYARKGSGISTVLDLNGKSIAVLDRSIQQQELVKLIGTFGLSANIVSAPDYKTTFEMVAKRKADAAATNRFFGMMHAKKYGLEDTAVIFNPSDLFFAAPKMGRGRFLQIIDAHLSKLKKDSRSVYYESMKRWTSEEVHFKLPQWVKILGLVVGAILLTSIAGASVLKHQVNVRTRELKEVNLEMEERIKRRTAELAEAMEKARAADRIKSAFLATMSHELRTPLNSIIGFTGIMLQGLTGPLNDEQKKQMTMVQTSSRHLLALINDVLDISKIEAGQLELAVEPFELRPSIEKVVRLVAPLAEKKGLELTLEADADLGAATTDQRRLEQILLNLLNNAIKFTEKGRVAVSCKSENGDYLLSVSDTGIGMKPEELPNLFQPFHQLDSGLTRKHEGTGLGLSICRKIIEMMGGSIFVESRLGQGSVFTIRFPKHTEKPHEKNSPDH